MITLLLEEEFSLVEIGTRTTNGYFTRNTIITVDEIEYYRDLYNNTDVYTTIYRYDSKNQNESNLYAPLYFDLDCNDLTKDGSENEAFEIIREDAKKILAILNALFYIEEEQVEIYFSGAKGVHIIVPEAILGIQPCKDLNNIFHTLITDIKRFIPHGTVDTKIYDSKRLFRLPNSINSKTGLYKIPLHPSELRTLSYNDIRLLAQQQRNIPKEKPRYNTRANRMFNKYVDEWKKILQDIEDRKNKTYNNTFKYTPPCIKSILEEGIKEGSRNNTVASVASFFKQQGLSEAEVTDRLTKFNAEMVQPPLNVKEIERTVSSIYCGEYKYGCRTLIELDYCKDECKIAQKRGK